MADFSVNLSGPQAQGASPVAAVRSAVETPEDYSMLEGVTGMLAKAFKKDDKADKEARKNAVIKEYLTNEGVYTDALTSGQWQSAHVGLASRANFKKMISSYPEYISELMEAKKSVYDGTETGEAQKQVDREMALRENDKKQAGENGYVFYPGMGPDAENKTIDAFKYGQRVRLETEQRYKQNAEIRAQNSENRAGESHINTMHDYQAKEEVIKGLVTMADKNFDALGSITDDLVKNTSMNPEQKMAAFQGQVRNLKQGIASISASNPSFAAPWQKLIEDMEVVAMKRLDPKAKTQQESDILKNEWEVMVYKAKIAAVNTNPQLMKYVVAGQLFNDPSQITLHGSAQIGEWLNGAASGDPTYKPTPMLGTDQEKPMLKALKGAIGQMQSGKVADQAKAEQEALNAANTVLRETGKLNNGAIPPDTLKDLSSFYGSAEFGKLAAGGKVDKQSMQSAKQVFQVSYEPAVSQAIMKRLDETVNVGGHARNPGANGHTDVKSGKMSEQVDIQFSGSGVVFKDKTGSFQSIGSSFTRKGLDEAQAGLNQLIRIGAHMEGTTDYGKYWEANRHLLMPGFYMKDLKEGTAYKGYLYLGGDARNPKSWEKQKMESASETFSTRK